MPYPSPGCGTATDAVARFLNADLIAAELSPFAPETQNFHAGRLLIERIAGLVEEGEDFGVDLPGRDPVKGAR